MNFAQNGRMRTYFQNTLFTTLLIVLLGILPHFFPGRLWASPAALTEPLERPAIVLGQGEQRLLKSKRGAEITRYSVGNDRVRAHLLSSPASQLLLKGITPGSTDLWVWKQDGSTEHRLIEVQKLSIQEIPPPLVKAMSHLDQIEIIYSGSGIIFRGVVSDPAESARIIAISRAFPKEVSDQTELSEDLLTEMQQRLENALKRASLDQCFRVERFGPQLWVRGNAETPAQGSAAQKMVESVFPAARLEILSLPDDAPTVHFKVFLLELKKNRFSSLGLSWSATQTGAVRITPAGILNQLELEATLQLLEGDGSARILSKPELVVRAPGEAELFAGGELPLKVRNKYTSSVDWKNYGLTLRLKVTHSSRERVRVDIFTEVSHLDLSTALNDIPGIQANRMKTQVDARYGTPLLLSGLLQDQQRETANGFPLLRQLPIIGALFGSEDYLKERSELVAILLPTLAPPQAPMSRVEGLENQNLPSEPLGPVPPPRNWLTPDQIQILKNAPDYPWNALR